MHCQVSSFAYVLRKFKRVRFGAFALVHIQTTWAEQERGGSQRTLTVVNKDEMKIKQVESIDNHPHLSHSPMHTHIHSTYLSAPLPIASCPEEYKLLTPPVTSFGLRSHQKGLSNVNKPLQRKQQQQQQYLSCNCIQ